MKFFRQFLLLVTLIPFTAQALSVSGCHSVAFDKSHLDDTTVKTKAVFTLPANSTEIVLEESEPAHFANPVPCHFAKFLRSQNTGLASRVNYFKSKSFDTFKSEVQGQLDSIFPFQYFW